MFVASVLNNLIAQFPVENREVIYFLIGFLRRIAANEVPSSPLLSSPLCMRIIVILCQFMNSPSTRCRR